MLVWRGGTNMRMLRAAAIVLGLFATLLMVVERRPRVARIHVVSPVVHVGTMDQLHTRKEFEFRIVNQGRACLEVTRVHAQCACLKTRLSRTRLAPGEQALLKGTVHSRVQPGEANDKILLYSNDPVDPVVKLSVKSYVEPICMAVPASVVVRDLRRGESRLAEVEVLGPMNDSTFEVLRTSPAGSAIEILDISEIVPIKKTGKRHWKVSLRITARPADRWEDAVVVTTTSTKVPSLKVPIIVNQIPEFAITPRVVSLVLSHTKEEDTATVEIVA